jgi:hypothetical protein
MDGDLTMNMRKLFLLAPLALVTACGSQAACEDFVAALDSCTAEALGDLGDSATTGTDDICESDDAAETSSSEFKCGTAAIEGGDCSTLEGLTAISVAVADCEE